VYFGDVTLGASAQEELLAIAGGTCEESESASDAGMQSCVLPELAGLEPVGTTAADVAGQIIYLNFDGAEGIVYNGSVTVGPFDVPAFDLSGELVGQEQTIIASLLTELEETFAGSGVVFTTEQPTAGTEYSTIYIGGDDSVFASYGSFLGLAELVDTGNLESSDRAVVFSDLIVQQARDRKNLARTLAGTIAHEAGHLLGYPHTKGFLDLRTLASHGRLGHRPLDW